MSLSIDSGSPCHNLYPALQNKNERWFTTWRGHIVIQEKSLCGLRNLIGFVSALKKVNYHIANNASDRMKCIALDMQYQALKVEKKLTEHSIFIRLVLKVIVFVSTGTTLHRQTAQLHHVGGAIQNTQKSLIDAAEVLLNGADGIYSYKASSRDYLIPIRWDGLSHNMQHHRQPMHGLLHHLQKGFKYNVSQLIDLLRQGRSWDDLEVIELTDICMQQACWSYKLAIQYEAVWLTERIRVSNKAHAMTEQRVFPWLVVMSFDLLYRFVRSGIIFDGQGNWTRTALKNSEAFNKFYDDQSPQGRWRQQFNEVIELLDKNIGIDAVKVRDGRFLSQLDITEPQSCILTQDPAEFVSRLLDPF